MKDSYNFNVAGVQFHELKLIIGDVHADDNIDLVPEPTNEYDPNAVRLYHGETMVGFVPKQISAEVATMIELFNATCTVIECIPSAKPWEQLNVKITKGEPKDE